MSQRQSKMDRAGVEMLKEMMLLHDAQIAVLLDMLARREVLKPEEYRKNLVKLIEFRNKQYRGGVEDGSSDEEHLEAALAEVAHGQAEDGAAG